MAEPYDVFISHCGNDCKRDFAVWLKKELEVAGVRCFLDERDLKLGDPAAETMLKAMAEAKYGVVILSKGFFEREWCVKELETFLGRKNVLPLFLGMAPGELGGVVESVRGRRVWERFERFSWTEAEYLGIVEQAGKHTGLRLEAVDDFWDGCIRRLKSELLFLLDKLDGGVKLLGPGPLFGVEEHLAQIKQLLGVWTAPLETEQDEWLSERVGEGEGRSGGEVNEIRADLSGLPRAGGGNSGAREVGIVGVKGMGGVGKTTLAKRLYDDADVRSFLSGRVCWVEVNEKPGPEKVCRLQEQVIWKLCHEEVRIYSPTEGRAEIRKRLGRGGAVLICFDDMWDDGDPAVVETADLGPGSRILKTTRDSLTIGSNGLQHDLDVLGPLDAERLFLWHAFRGAMHLDQYPALISPTVAYCGGLPLALEIMGSLVAAFLVSDDGLARWTDLVADLHGGQSGETRPGRLVQNVLMRSYDSLPDWYHKDAFVLIAGLWPDEPKFRRERMVVAYLGASVYGHLDVDSRQRRARTVLSELSYRSLLRVESTNDDIETFGSFRVTVHDLLVDIARSVTWDGIGSTSGVTKRRFLRWVEKTHTEPPSDNAIEHLIVHPLTSANFPHSLLCSGAKVVSFIAKVPHTLAFSDLAPGLRWCRLLIIKPYYIDCHLSLNGLEGLTNLQVLDLNSGFWARRGGADGDARFNFPSSLKSLSHVHLVSQLVHSLHFTDLVSQGLVELILDRCIIPETFKSGPFFRLQHAEICNCNFPSLSTNLFSSSSALTHLELWGSLRIDLRDYEKPGKANENFQVVEQKMLRHLVLKCCNKFPSSLFLGPSMTCLEISRCLDIALPKEFALNMQNLGSLTFLSWPNLRTLPRSINSLLNLSKLVLSGCSVLESLPTEVSSLTKLTWLDLRRCSALKSLPESFGSLKALEYLDLRECESLQELPVSGLTSLHTLSLDYCRSLRGWPSSLNSLTSLDSLSVEGISEPAFCHLNTTMPWLAPKINDSIFEKRCHKKIMGFVCGSVEFRRMVKETSSGPSTGCYTCSEEELRKLPEFKDLHPLLQDLLLQNSRDKQWFLEKVPFIRGRNLHLAKCDNCDMCPIDGIRFKSVKQEDFDLCQACFDLFDKKDETFHEIEYPVFRPKVWPFADAILKEGFTLRSEGRTEELKSANMLIELMTASWEGHHVNALFLERSSLVRRDP